MHGYLLPLYLSFYVVACRVVSCILYVIGETYKYRYQ